MLHIFLLHVLGIILYFVENKNTFLVCAWALDNILVQAPLYVYVYLSWVFVSYYRFTFSKVASVDQAIQDK